MSENLDQVYLQKAIELAKKAFHLGEVPIGAVVVLGEQIIGEGYNCVESSKNASNHAEMVAMQSAASFLKNWRLTGATLYTTLEPCPMCLGAAILFRIEKIVWSCKDLRHGAVLSVYKLLETKHPIHQVQSVHHENVLMEEEIQTLLKDFFKMRRR